MYREGKEKYPNDIRFPRALGHLYYGRKLYRLAWDEYRRAEAINPNNINIKLRLANTAADLNLDKTSVEYFEKVITADPDNREAISGLGWMYYKVHRFEDGEKLLLSAVDRFGEDAELSMTLGTLYSNMYRYDEGKYWYEKSIVLGEKYWGFSAIAHYNLSIMESRFHYYDLAMDRANASLDSQVRASGYLSRGELNMRRLDLEKAQADYNAAREIDPSPLAKINLAQTYRISGRLEEARLYAENCLNANDLSWMSNYGIDPVRYKRDIYEILYKTYKGLTGAQKFIPHYTLGEKIRSVFKTVSYRFYSSVYRKLYQKYSLAAGDAYSAEFDRIDDKPFPPLEPFIQYYNAFETYPRRAVFYLNMARNLETAIIPLSEPSYILEEGVLFKDLNLIGTALKTLDPVWERELISQCYRELALRGRKFSRRNAAAELFALNRGALLQAGIRLPVEMNISFDGSGTGTRRNAKILSNALSKAGFQPVRTGEARYVLDISLGTAVSCTLIDTEGVTRPMHRRFSLNSVSKKDIYAFAEAFSGYIFRVE